MTGGVTPDGIVDLDHLADALGTGPPGLGDDRQQRVGTIQPIADGRRAGAPGRPARRLHTDAVQAAWLDLAAATARVPTSCR